MRRFDAFLRTGRRFSFLIGHPLILRTGLRFAVGTQGIANVTLQVMGNLVDSSTPGVGGFTMRSADRLLGAGGPAPAPDPRRGLSSARHRRGARGLASPP